MSFDIKKFLGEMGFKPEQVEELAPKFEAPQVSALESRLVSPDQRKRLEALDAEEKRYQEANERLNAEMAEWASMTAAERDASTKLQNDLFQSQQEVLRLQQSVESLATRAGVDPKTVLPAKSETVAPAKKDPVMLEGFDPKRYVSINDFSAVSKFAIELPSKLMKIARDHHALTGEDLDTDAIVSEIQANAGKKDGTVDPVAIWERKYDIPAKREAARQKKYDDDLRAAEERGAERARSEQALPPTAAAGRHAIVFGTRSATGQMQPRTSALKRPQPETTVRSAAAALATGKYRTDQRRTG